jgi:hypothetical protein
MGGSENRPYTFADLTCLRIAVPGFWSVGAGGFVAGVGVVVRRLWLLLLQLL